MKVLKFLGRGVGHEDNNVLCQDYLVQRTQNGRTVLALSDGCSSSKYADYAAKISACFIADLFTRYGFDNITKDNVAKTLSGFTKGAINEYVWFPETDDIISLLQSAYYSIFKYASACKGTGIYDFCATLIFAVVENDKVLVGHIGDGNIICYRDENVVYRSAEDNGGSDVETYFTVSPDFAEHFRMEVITEEVDRIVLFSDGPQKMFYYEGEGDICKGVEKVFKFVPENNDDLKNILSTDGFFGTMHYVFDDWSFIYCDLKQEGKLTSSVKPISLKQLFLQWYNKNYYSDKNSEICEDTGTEEDKVVTN